MSEPISSPTHEEFARLVHDALNRLYDSVYLQTQPLAGLLADGNAGAPLRYSESLRRTLLGAIQSLQPKPGTPAESPDWRAHNILELRYIEGLSVGEVAGQLGLSQSQYFRDQARALEALTAVLWEQYQESQPQITPIQRTANASRQEAIRSETERLSTSAQRQPLDVAELVRGLRPVLDRLALAKGITIDYDLSNPQVAVLASRVMVRQAILSLLTYALDTCPSGGFGIGTFVGEREAGLRVAWSAGALCGTPETCSHLMAALGGWLEVRRGAGGGWEARLVWPADQPRVLLIVDDNEGLIDLFRRCLAGYAWQVLGARNGAEARQVLATAQPTVIVMDVMMPEEDGWELLSALKSDRDLKEIPVIVCSVLNEPHLALTLGAAAFLPKPVTQAALLQALAPWHSAGANPMPARQR